MRWIRYTGPVDRVSVPRWQIGYGHPDGLPGWPRLEPLEVSAEAYADLIDGGHPEWEKCAKPKAGAATETPEG